MDFTSLLNTPITQLAAVALFVGALQKMGIDVVGLLKWFFKNSRKEGEVEESSHADLLAEFASLRQYVNHDQTELLTEIRDLLKDNFSVIHTKHSEWDKYGIKSNCKEK